MLVSFICYMCKLCNYSIVPKWVFVWLPLKHLRVIMEFQIRLVRNLNMRIFTTLIYFNTKTIFHIVLTGVCSEKTIAIYIILQLYILLVGSLMNLDWILGSSRYIANIRFVRAIASLFIDNLCITQIYVLLKHV